MCLLMEIKSLCLKLSIKMLTFQQNFVLNVFLMEMCVINGNVCDFSVDYNFIDKSDILNIHKYLMTKNNIK